MTCGEVMWLCATCGVTETHCCKSNPLPSHASERVASRIVLDVSFEIGNHMAAHHMTKHCMT